MGSDSIIAAGAVVLQGTKVPSNSIYAGVPAKFVKNVKAELLEVFKRGQIIILCIQNGFNDIHVVRSNLGCSQIQTQVVVNNE